jgi:hypothetical protein
MFPIGATAQRSVRLKFEPGAVLEKEVIWIRRAQRPQGQAADAVNKTTPPLASVTRISRIGLTSSNCN